MAMIWALGIHLGQLCFWWVTFIYTKIVVVLFV